MKKIFNIGKLSVSAMIMGAVLASSCNKVTDLQPNNSFSEESAFSSPARVALAVTGVYSAAQAGPYTDGSNRGYPFGAANTLQQDARGEDVIAVPSFFGITYGNTYGIATANNQGIWETMYNLINRANVVIEGVKKASASGVITANLALQYEGEARFLRALAHHELLVHFARPYSHTADASHLGVPYRTVAASSPSAVDANKNQPRNTVKECYDKLIEDLNFAELNLPPTYTGGTLKVSRATKGAAIALKTRIYLHKGDWPSVITEGNKIISTTAPFTSPIGGYALTATPSAPFVTANNFTNTESIFSIENSTTRNSGTNGSISTMYTNTPGRALVAISPVIYNASFWLPSDLRRSTLTVVNSTKGVFSTKYPDYTTWTDANPIIRYAEVLLNVAEAYSRQTALSPQALALLNAVRNRSVTTVANQYTIANFATGVSLTQAILNERRIEFLAEGHRWGDIHRLANDPNFTTNGIPAKVDWAAITASAWNANVPYTGPKDITAVPYTDFKFVWPFPLSETNTNPILKAQQNPGW
jgi:starch-binding outer membrane protein, SusD/RagB family